MAAAGNGRTVTGVIRLIVLLAASNVFMTAAWFAHLRHPEWPLAKAILVSWLIAGLEYALAIPAIRAAHAHGISPATIKVTQEAVTLLVFALVVAFILAQTGLSWRFVVAAVLLMAAAAVAAGG